MIGLPITPLPDPGMPSGDLIEVRGVSKRFDLPTPLLDRLMPGGRRRRLHAVDEVSFTLRRGETLALVGESGCGKSTLARILVGLHQPTAGDILFEGRSLAGASDRRPAELRRRIQMVFQDPYASLDPRWRVGDIIAEPLLHHGVVTRGPQVAGRVAELLRTVGLAPSDAGRYPHQFSGGQRQRISIARALATHPDFLVCDEPTSALDVSVQAQVLNLMKELQRREGLTYLFISHNLAVVRHVADRVGVMYLGRIVELAPKRTLFAAPRHPYTRLLLEAVPDLDAIRRDRTPLGGEVPNPINPPSGCHFHPRCPIATERCRGERPLLRMLEDGSAVACHLATSNI